MIPIPDKPDCRLSRDNTETLPASPRIPRLARRPPRGRARSARPGLWRSAVAAGAELRPQAGQTKVPCCRKAISVWTACPDNQKPTGGSLAEGTCVAGVPLRGQGHNRCVSLRLACGTGAILHAERGECGKPLRVVAS